MSSCDLFIICINLPKHSLGDAINFLMQSLEEQLHILQESTVTPVKLTTSKPSPIPPASLTGDTGNGESSTVDTNKAYLTNLTVANVSWYINCLPFHQ